MWIHHRWADNLLETLFIFFIYSPDILKIIIKEFVDAGWLADKISVRLES